MAQFVRALEEELLPRRFPYTLRNRPAGSPTANITILTTGPAIQDLGIALAATKRANELHVPTFES